MAQRRLLNRSLGTSSRKYAHLNKCAGKLADFCHALFPLLVINSDDHGRQPGDAFSVKNSVFPISKHSESDFEKALRYLHDSILISIYEDNGNQYLYVHNFRREQPGIKYIAKSRFPEPPKEVLKREQLTGFHRISPDLPLEVEEKRSRREVEEKKNQKRVSNNELFSTNPLGIFIEIPLKDKSDYQVTSTEVKEWKQLYPDVDVKQELRNYRGWALNNPQKRKTRRGIKASINSWLKGEQRDKNKKQVSVNDPGTAQSGIEDDPLKWPAERWELFEKVNGKEAAEKLRESCNPEFNSTERS